MNRLRRLVCRIAGHRPYTLITGLDWDVDFFRVTGTRTGCTRCGTYDAPAGARGVVWRG
ncbi:hypothetical protein [Micromonospora rosaria]|uniref:hypothetical protein n=1 Tax=Micromonospora rosaria TaxID=47874 RepID=UPI000A78486A|nr:hypothetical protein [Micromonospora rosaria]